MPFDYLALIVCIIGIVIFILNETIARFLAFILKLAAIFIIIIGIYFMLTSIGI